MSAALVGRVAELSRVARLLAEVRAGRAATILVEGEAGIGKTRVLAEILEGADDFLTLHGACHEIDRSVPFAALVEAFGLTGDDLDAELAAAAALLRGARSDVDSAESPRAGALGFQAVELLVAWLETCVARAPILIAIDDLHWADAGTIRALRTIARRLSDRPIALLAALRPAPRSPDLAALVEAAVCNDGAVLRLEPLGSDPAERLAFQLVGAPLGPGLRRHVAAAGGNPLFITELVRALDAEGAIVRSSGMADTTVRAVPEDVRLALRGQLARLPVDVFQTLQLATVLGESFDPAELAAAQGRRVAALLRDVNLAVEAGLIGPDGARLSFRHPLVREVLYAGIPEAMRVALHRDVANALTALGADSVRVAVHARAAARVGDEAAIRSLRRAAAEVLPRSGTVAVELLESAWALTEPGTTRHAEVAAELVTVLAAMGRTVDPEVHLAAATGPLRDPAAAAALRLTAAGAMAMRSRWTDALAQLELADSDLPAVMRTQASSLAAYGRFSLGAVDEAGRSARCVLDGSDDRGGRLVAEMVLALAAALDGDTGGAVRRARAAVRNLAEFVATPIGVMLPRFSYMQLLFAVDRFDEVDAILREASRQAERADLPTAMTFNAIGMISLAFLTGEWDDALAHAETAIGLAVDLESWPSAYAYAVAVTVLVGRGRLDQAQALLDEAAWMMRGGREAIGDDALHLAHALLHEARGHTQDAADRAEEALACTPPAIRLLCRRPVLAEAVRLLVEAGRHQTAQRATVEIEAAAARAGVPSFIVTALRCRGLVDGDADLLARAAMADVYGPRLLERTLAQDDAAKHLVDAGRAKEAGPLYAAALDGYRRMGSTRDAARLTAAMRRARVRRPVRLTRPVSGWAALTPSELAVAELIAEGLTNPAVAERLGISRYTVETHLKRVFAKLGVTSRTALAAEAGRRPAPETSGGRPVRQVR